MEENKTSKLVETLREPKTKETLKKITAFDMMYTEYLTRVNRETYIQYQKQLEERRKNESQ